MVTAPDSNSQRRSAGRSAMADSSRTQAADSCMCRSRRSTSASRVGGRLLEQVAEVRIRVDAVPAHERGGPAEQRLFGGVAADGGQERQLVQRLR